MRQLLVAAVLLLSASATAQRSNYNKYLIPLATEEAPGAHGSLWRTEWVVHNAGTSAVPLLWNRCVPHAPPCTSQQVPARTTVLPGIFSRALSEGSQGAFVYVPKSADPLLSMSLRVRDLSKNAQSFGTELPIVAEDQYARALFLLDVPTGPKYRATLRLYGPDETLMSAQVTVYAELSSTIIEQYPVQLEGVVFIQEPEFPLFPAYAELDPLSPAVRAASERVRIVVESERPMWAFATITDNETQQVTTVTPK